MLRGLCVAWIGEAEYVFDRGDVLAVVCVLVFGPLLMVS